MKILVIEKTLTDGSKVYDVHAAELELAANTQTDAIDLAEKLADAINAHTTETAETVWNIPA